MLFRSGNVHRGGRPVEVGAGGRAVPVVGCDVDGRDIPGSVGFVGVSRPGVTGAGVVLGDAVGVGEGVEPPDEGGLVGAAVAGAPGAAPAPPPLAEGAGLTLPGRAMDVTSPPTDSGAAALESTCFPSVAVPVSVPNPVIATCVP